MEIEEYCRNLEDLTNKYNELTKILIKIIEYQIKGKEIFE